MSLFVVATPIGHPGDITLRAIEVLRTCDVVIGEERAHASKLLKHLGLSEKRLEVLNEHSRPADLADLAELCRSLNCALISDAGTPVFCDPGAVLVQMCRAQHTLVVPVPGASSLMALLQLSSTPLKNFLFVGFLPRDAEERAQAIYRISREPYAQVVMDTPYRLTKLLNELATAAPERRALLAMDLTLESEKIVEGALPKLATDIGELKAEFMLLIYEGAPARSISQTPQSAETHPPRPAPASERPGRRNAAPPRNKKSRGLRHRK